MLYMFAPPDFIRMPAFGIDISSDDIRYVELLPHSGGMKLGRHGAVPLAEGIVSRGRIEDASSLAKVLGELARREKIRYANISLPEEQSFLTQMELPRVSRKDLRSAIELHLEEYVPIPPQDAAFDFVPLYDNAEAASVIAGVIPDTVVSQYVKICKDAGITLKSMELQSQAMARAMFGARDRGTYMGVDIGRDLTHVFIVHDGEVHFSALLEIGGNNITEVMASKLGVEQSVADAMKVRFGLLNNPEHPEIREIVRPVISDLRERIMQYFAYWQHRHDGSYTIERVVLTGGGANLVGVVEYLGQGMNASFSVANPWVNVCDFEKYLPSITLRESQGYTAAIGLALRGDYLE